MFQGDECSGGWVSRGMGVPAFEIITVKTFIFVCPLFSRVSHLLH